MGKTTKSVVVRQFGGYDVLKVEDVPLPELDGKIEVDVEYGSLNFCDIYKRLGFFDKPLPFVMGSECCGVVTKLGVETADFNVGDRVVCYDFEEGMYRQTLRVSPEKCFKIPAEMLAEDGGAIFLNYLTAFFALFELGRLKPGDNVLIKSCAGGFGCAATQLSKTIENITVYGVSSNGKERFAIENGVDFVYDRNTDYVRKLRSDCPDGFDLILDNESGSCIGTINDLLRPLGKVVLLSANSMINDSRSISFLSKAKLFFGVLTFRLSSFMDKSTGLHGLHMGNLVRKDPERARRNLDAIFEMYKSRKIKPRIDSVWPLEKVGDATKLLGDRKNCGKVLIRMK